MLSNATVNHADLWLTVLVTIVVLGQWVQLHLTVYSKTKRLAGRMGGNRVTIQNLEVVRVDAERNVILIKGNVPGAKKSLITIKSAVKAK